MIEVEVAVVVENRSSTKHMNSPSQSPALFPQTFQAANSISSPLPESFDPFPPHLSIKPGPYGADLGQSLSPSQRETYLR